MSDKEARVRLSLTTGGFTGPLGSLVNETKKQANHLESAFSGAKKGLLGLGGEIKNVAKFGLGLGGGFALAEAAKTAVGAESSYKNLAFAIHAGTGEAVRWQDIQARVQATAAQWKQRNGEVAESFREIQDETGNLKFTERAISSAAKAATATGKDIGLFAGLAGTMFEKFSIGADQIDEAIASVVSFGNRGGLTLEEINSRLGQMGASAKMAGESGVAGLSRILGMSQMADDSLGNMRQKITAVTGLLDEMANPEQAKKIGKELHVNLLDKKGNVKTDAIDTVLAKTGGDPQKLAQIFTGPTAKLMAAFGKIYQEGADAGGGKGKKRTEDGLAAFHRAVEAAAKSELDKAELEKQAIEKTKSAKSAMNGAMNELENEFSKPEMIDAMKTMAQIMPKLASAVAKLLETAIKHPLLAGAGVFGAKIGGGIASQLGASLMSSLGRKFVAAISEQTVSVTVKPIVDGLGMKIGEEIITKASAPSPWRNAGTLIGAGIAIALLAELAKHSIDEIFNNQNKIQNDSVVADARTVEGTSREQQIESIKKLKANLSEQQGGRTDEWAFEEHKFERPEIRKQKRTLKALQESVRANDEKEAKARQEIADKGFMVVDSMKRMAQATDEAVRRLRRLGDDGGGSGSNGIPPPGSNEPGHR